MIFRNVISCTYYSTKFVTQSFTSQRQNGFFSIKLYKTRINYSFFICDYRLIFSQKQILVLLAPTLIYGFLESFVCP